MSFSKHHCSKSPFRKEGGDPPEEDMITSYTYQPGNNNAASRYKEIIGGNSSGNGNVEKENKNSKGKKIKSTRHISVSF